MNLRRMEADAGCETGSIVCAAVVLTAAALAVALWVVGALL